MQQTAFTTQKDFGREAREAAWAREQRTLHGLQTVETRLFTERHTFRDINLMAEEAKRRAEIARSVMLSQHTPLHTHRESSSLTPVIVRQQALGRSKFLSSIHHSSTFIYMNTIATLIIIVIYHYVFCRLRELHTLKGRVESFAKLKGLDIDAINQHYTV